MSVCKEIDRNVDGYVPRALHPAPDAEWIRDLPEREQIAAKALIAARDDVSAEAPRLAIEEALKKMRFDTPGKRGEDAVRRGRAGETLSAGDWNALADCVAARLANEAREVETVGPFDTPREGAKKEMEKWAARAFDSEA